MRSLTLRNIVSHHIDGQIGERVFVFMMDREMQIDPDVDYACGSECGVDWKIGRSNFMTSVLLPAFGSRYATMF
jgi:hypothetical protein